MVAHALGHMMYMYMYMLYVHVYVYMYILNMMEVKRHCKEY